MIVTQISVMGTTIHSRGLSGAAARNERDRGRGTLCLFLTHALSHPLPGRGEQWKRSDRRPFSLSLTHTQYHSCPPSEPLSLTHTHLQSAGRSVAPGRKERSLPRLCGLCRSHLIGRLSCGPNDSAIPRWAYCCRTQASSTLPPPQIPGSEPRMSRPLLPPLASE